MSLPERLAGAVDDEDVVARVPLGGDDVLVVTPTRTLVYRAEGLLSDETVEEYGHDVERVDVSKGRRKAKLTLSYGLEGERTVSLPAKQLDDVLHPVLAGILSGSGVTESGESVLRTFRFSELTLIITSHRLVKHIGSAVWDEEFEEFPYDELTGLDFEEGTVATAVVLTHAGRSERFKAPNESARAVKETLTDAVCEFYDVDSLEEFRLTVAESAEEEDDDSGPTDFGNGPDPLSASPVADAEAADDGEAAATTENTAEEFTVAEAAGETTGSTDPLGGEGGTEFAAEPADPGAGTTTESVGEAGSDGAGGSTETDDAFEGSAFESAGVEEKDLSAEVAELREAVEHQSERIDRQAELIDKLIEELRRGR